MKARFSRARRVARGRGLRLVVAGSAVLASSLVGLAGAPHAAAAPQSCGFATSGTGTFADTLCWFDLSSYNAAQATSAGGQQMTINLPNGYTITFTLNVTGGAVAPSALPTWTGSYLGNSGYTGVPGKPSLYQTVSGTTTTATMTSITMTNAGGQTVTGYSLIGADAESTDTGESITWTSSSTIASLGSLGNACGGGFTGVGSNTVTCIGQSVGNKTGTAILSSDAPATFTQSMKGSGLEGFAFGVLVSRVEVNKTVVNGFAGDAFTVTAANSSGTIVGSGSTGAGGASASTGQVTVLTNSSGEQYTFAESATAGTLADYTGSWSCTLNGASDGSLPSGAAGASANVAVHIGDFVNCTITNTADAASLSLTKHAATPVDVNGDGLTDAGDTIAYTFTVHNTGDLEIDNVGVADNTAGSVSCPQSTLAAGGSETCAADSPYTITAADVTAGSVHNTATAGGRVVGSAGTVTSPPSSTTTPTTAPAPMLTVAKSVSPAFVTAAGQTVTYSFLVTNTGNVTMSTLAVHELSFNGSGSFGAISCPVSILAPAATTTCTAPYQVTQADMDAGSVSNSADVTAIDPAGDVVTSSASTALLTATADPELSIVKSASPSGAAALRAGAVITYSYVVTNSGNVTITDVAVDEGAFTGTGTPPAVNCPAGVTSLAPGDQLTCTAAYTVTQTDVDAGILSNTASATGTPPVGITGPIDSPPSTVSVPVTPEPSLSVVKTASVTTLAVAGQPITYSFLITNTGNVTITDATVNEGAFTGTGTMSAVTCPAGAASLTPGIQVTCTATYTVTQADIDAGGLTNTATASGTPPAGVTGPVISAPSTLVLPGTARPALTVVKSASPTTLSKVGQPITYSFLVTNTGNVTITGVGVTDTDFTGSGILSAVGCPAGASTLAPAATITCTATYQATQHDLDAGTISNTAFASGEDPAQRSIFSPPSTAKVRSTAISKLGLRKTAHTVDVNHDNVIDAGDRIDWSLVVTNLGATTITHLTVSDPTAGKVTCPTTTLAPADSTTCTVASHQITATDATVGDVHNTATATGKVGNTAVISSSAAHAEVTVHATPNPKPAPTPGLPFTGFAMTLPLTAGGVMLVLLGAIMIFAATTRRRGI